MAQTFTSNFDLDTMVRAFLAKEFRSTSKKDRMERGFFNADNYSKILIVLDEIIKENPEILSSVVIENKVYRNKDISFFDFNDVWGKRVAKSTN